MSLFPGAIASFLGFTSGHTLSADQHAAQHNSEQAEIVATQTKIGTGLSTPTSGLLLRGNGAGTSAWSQVILTSDVSGILPVANGGTGQASLSGLPIPSAVLSNPVISGTVSGGATFNSPVLATPNIADFTNANHTHASVSQGGQLVGSTALTNTSVTADKLNTGAKVASVITAETTASTSYVSLATATDSITVTIGANGLALLCLNAESFNSGAGALNLATYSATGANTIAASDANIMSFTSGNGAANEVGSGGTILLTGLTPGATTFSMKYRTTAGTATFERRNISVVPL